VQPPEFLNPTHQTKVEMAGLHRLAQRPLRQRRALDDVLAEKRGRRS
jgi:hypothetical protein